MGDEAEMSCSGQHRKVGGSQECHAERAMW